MTIDNLWLIIMLVCCAIWLPIRIRKIARLSQKDGRLFWFFWVWPLLLFVHQQLLRIWLCHPGLYLGLFSFIWVGMLGDGCYYFLIKTKRRFQVLAALGSIPAALLMWALYKPQTAELKLILPHHGRAWVWHQPLFKGDTYFFMKPSSSPSQVEQTFDDPNFGQAIFAPCSGKVGDFSPATGILQIIPEGFPQTRISLGPFLPESLRVKQASLVVAGQPLGLQRESGAIPGIQLTVKGSDAFVFRDYLAGQWWARAYASGMPRRNQTVASHAENRFRLQPPP